jgi:predicted SAM-dependent methyltransferase
MLKLNLGSGEQELKDYVNLDIKKGNAVFPLSDYETGTVDEVRASHILEHYQQSIVKDILREWVRILKPGGIIKIAVPDFDKLARSYAEGKDLNYTGYILGGQTDANDFHRSMFNAETLTGLLRDIGVEEIIPWDSEIKDCASLPISLNLMGKKKQQSASFATNYEKPKDKIKKIPALTNVKAIISMPRIGFADNMFTALNVLLPLGCRMIKVHGAYWSHCLENGIERLQEENPKYVLTTDYDSWFTKEHVLALYLLMENHPEIDAVFPMQVKRDEKSIMARLSGMPKTKDGVAIDIPVDALFSKLFVPAETGHFGLTMIRADAIKKMKKPWFKEIPGKNGNWKEDFVDPDIYFWNNFLEAGCKAYLAPGIRIAHLQLAALWPGTEESQYKPFWTYLKDLEDGKIPDGCIPDLRKYGL